MSTLSTNDRPRLGYVILYVPDVAETLRFYEQAFGVERRFLHESGEYAELETGATALAFAAEHSVPVPDVFVPNRLASKAAAAEVGLVVDDLQVAFDRALHAGATPVLAPVTKPWGQTIAYVRDLNGFLVELCTEVK
jgi:catechol 2,3-dioxygenase-like lactoylglutathione lyase family enzyme